MDRALGIKKSLKNVYKAEIGKSMKIYFHDSPGSDYTCEL